MTLTSTAPASDAFAERVKVSRVTANLFAVLGVAPARGRGIRAGDERAGRDRRGEPRVVAVALRRRRGHPRPHGPPEWRRVRDRRRHARRLRLSRAGHGRVDAARSAARATHRTAPTTTSPRSAASHRGTSADAARLDLQRVARELQQERRGRVSSRRAVEHRLRVAAPEPVRPHAPAARAAHGGGGVRPAHRVRQRRDHVAAARARPAARDLDPPRHRRHSPRRDSAARDRSRGPVRAGRARRAAAGARSGSTIAEGLRARRHSAAARGGHQRPHRALHRRGAGRRDPAGRPRARRRGLAHERLRGHRADRPLVGQPQRRPASATR